MNRLKMSGQAGFSLIELMIAMLLGLMLTAGAIQVLLSTQQSYRLQENMSRVQENGRFAVELIARDLRMTGFSHCGALGALAIHNNVKGAGNTADPAFEYSSEPVIRPATDVPAVDGSDSVFVRYMHESGLRVVDVNDGKGNPNNANIKVGGNALGLKQDDVVTVTNCRESDTFRITNKPQETDDENQQVTLAHAANANLAPKLKGSYADGDRLLQAVSARWYVGDTGRVHEDGSAIRALYREAGNGPEAIVDDVETMRIHYGIDDTGNREADRYTRAAGVTDWSSVAAVRVSLMLQTADGNLADSDQTVIFDNAIRHVTDRRVRRVFATTVALRNSSAGGSL